jgi:hypothetical protein
MFWRFMGPWAGAASYYWGYAETGIWDYMSPWPLLIAEHAYILIMSVIAFVGTGKTDPMPSRYENLRQAVIHLAAPADEQIAYLDDILSPLTGGKSAAGYGNDELALELEDYFLASGDMVERGELTDNQAAAIRRLDTFLAELSGKDHADFWQRDALARDPRWAHVRAMAADILRHLPVEARAIGRSAQRDG